MNEKREKNELWRGRGEDGWESGEGFDSIMTEKNPQTEVLS